jgi:transposase
VQVPATNAIIELAEQLACHGIQRVVVESTSDYWRAWWSLLEARGLVVWLCNARDVKHLPGRPEDRQAGCGVAGQAERAGHAAAVVCPPAQIRRLRDYTRLRSDLTQERGRQVQRLEQAAGWTP